MFLSRLISSGLNEDTLNEREKKNLTLSLQTVDLLDRLKNVLKKREKRFVPAGEIIDIAVHELAKKMRVN